MDKQKEGQNRIGEALNLRNMKKIELSEKTGLNRASISNWINQRYQPKHKAIALMAQALDVSEMWLAGYDAPMERAPEQKKMDKLAKLVHKMRGNDELFSLCSDIAELSDEQLAAISVMVKALNK